MRAAVDGRTLLPRRPSQNRADARRELAQTERFGDVIVGAEIEARDAIVLRRACGHHDDRQVPDSGLRPQDAAHLGAAQTRQVQIEDDDVRRMVGDGRRPGSAQIGDSGRRGPFSDL